MHDGNIRAVRVACDISHLDLTRPTGISVYAAFVLDALRARDDVELVVEEDRADTVLSLDGRFRAPRGARSVTAIYELGHLFDRGAYPARQWLSQNWRTASAARRSDALLAPSRAVAVGLTTYLRVDADRVAVVEPRPREWFRRARREDVDRLRGELHLPDPYLVAVGADTPRQNLGLLGRAWALARPRLPEGAGLVLAGPGASRTAIEGAIDVGRVEDEHLTALISGAAGWLRPAVYEGCSVGAMEAMACGTTPLVAATGALPRTVDKAGMVLDPHDPAEWAEAMVAIVERPEVRTALSNAARKTIADIRQQPIDLEPLLAALAGAPVPAPVAGPTC